MMRILHAVLAIAAVSGCASPTDHVLFVTKTSLGIEFDGTPASASIAYDRTEGYLGPRMENGAVPPVVAKISTNGKIFGRDVKQYYATGTAANTLTGSNKTASKSELEGEGKAMFFGTSTTFGIKVGFTTTLPDSFVFGYRRKELSLIPLGTTTKAGVTDVKERHYPSVIGVFASDSDVKTPSDTTLGLTQFFATGTAAESLAANQALKNEFQGFAVDAVADFKNNSRAQQRIVLDLVECFSNMPDAKLDAALDNAKELDVLYAASNYTTIKNTAASDKQKARGQYVTVMTTIDAGSPERTGRLAGHQVYVCELSKSK
jgi:hypothetical protein